MDFIKFRRELKAALHQQDLPKLQWLISIKGDNSIETVGDYYNTPPLSIAAELGNIEMARILIYYGANINGINYFDVTPLHMAAEKGHEKMCEFLLQNGADPNLLTKAGSKPENMTRSLKIKEVFKRHRNRLQDAARNDDIPSLEAYLASGLDVNTRNRFGTTAIWAAVDANKGEAFNYLLSKGGDANIPNNSGLTPLHRSVMNNDKILCQKLIEAKVNVNVVGKWQHDYYTPLSIAVMRGRLSIVELLVECEGIKLDYSKKGSLSALHRAVSEGYKDSKKIAEALLQKGADPDIKEETDATPLHFAAEFGREEMIKLLLQYGADVTLKDEDGKTPCDVAREAGYLNIVEILSKKEKELNQTKEKKESTKEELLFPDSPFHHLDFENSLPTAQEGSLKAV